VYEPSLDQAGHHAGPDSKLVRVSLHALVAFAHLRSLAQMTLKVVDEFARQLHDAIVQRNLTDIVDMIFVSDHGMTDTSNVRLVYLDDILGDDGMNAIEHEDGTQTMRVM
jgi:predicted AlkP superfamily pyrophosphatase or phosphodiesterase